MKTQVLELDFGQKKDEAMNYSRSNPAVTLGDFLRVYPARAREPLPPEYLQQPLKRFQIQPIKLAAGKGVDLSPERPKRGGVRAELDAEYAADVARGRARFAEPDVYPDKLSDNEAVQLAYHHELQAVARYLENDLSVLIVCDKILTEHIYEYVCHVAGKIPVLDTSTPAEARPPSQPEALDRAMQGQSVRGVQDNLPLLIRSLKENQVLVLRSLDILDAPPLIEVLYQGGGGGRKPQLLGFLDPSLEVKKVLTDRFAIRAAIMGLPRYIQPDAKKPPVYTVTRLLTKHERACFKSFDAEGLYKNVSGLNAVQFRNAMRYVGATTAPGSDSRTIYDEIRNFKTSTSDEIEIPDITFDDIGGYEQVKQELQRIVALMTGRVPGMDERERQKLIPRGFIFHGPPGTGKTLFAKAIANEMNATIQMVSGPEIMDKYVGQSESNLRHIFATARRNAPSVIFFDEFDSLASQRSNYSDGGSRANNAVVAQLLTELDGFREDQAVLVIGTTNRIDIIDEALLRPSRLKPIEIGQPNYSARRSVAGIHAAKFGIDKLLRDLCQMALDHLSAWEKDGQIPPAFLAALFAEHPPHKARYEMQARQFSFVRDLQGLFKLAAQAGGGDAPAAASPPLEDIERRILEIAPRYGLDLTRPDQPDLSKADESNAMQPMRADLRDLFQLLQSQRRQPGDLTPDTFVNSVMDIVAEYTDGFNNDEIRAIFQEASLEHHLDGQLITPRYLGMKIGLIRKRRDERQVVHLSDRRGRR
jgi:SpoVK/Ycf46/Vps4 family AAA+-type ATPase